jgi:hypothetical protein
VEGWKGKGSSLIGLTAEWPFGFLGGFWAETTTCEIIDADVSLFFFTLGFLNKAYSCDRGLQVFFSSMKSDSKYKIVR